MHATCCAHWLQFRSAHCPDLGPNLYQRTSEATALQDDIVRSFTEEERVRILEMSRAGDVYRKLARR